MQRKFKKKYLLIFLLAIGSISLIALGITYAKYASNSIWNYYLGSKGFYFTSDALGMQTVKNVNTLWDGEAVAFSLTNQENDLVSTEYDITYQVTCTVLNDENNEYSCTLNDTNSNTFSGTLSSYETCINYKNDGMDVSNYLQSECEINGYTWQKEAALKDMTFKVTKKDGSPVEEATVKIEATSTEPYKKTISGTFELRKDPTLAGTISLQAVKDGVLNNLFVTNSYNEEKCISISWNPDQYRLDEEKENFDSYTTNDQGYINSVTFKMNPKYTKKIYFYGTNLTQEINVADYTVTENANCQN